MLMVSCATSAASLFEALLDDVNVDVGTSGLGVVFHSSRHLCLKAEIWSRDCDVHLNAVSKVRICLYRAVDRASPLDRSRLV